MQTKQQERPPTNPFLARVLHSQSVEETDLRRLLVFALLVRIFFFCVYTPCWAGDSSGYTDVALSLHAHKGYDCARTPLYPILIGFCELIARSGFALRLAAGPAAAVVFLQQAFGIAACGLVYRILLNLRTPRLWAFVAALLFASLAGIGQFERYLLPLTFTLDLLTLGVWLVTEGLASDRRRFFAASGFVFSLAALTRPETIIFFVVFAAVLAICSVRTVILRRTLRPLLVGAVPLLLLWLLFVYACTRQVALSTLTGWNMASAVYNMWPRVLPKDQVLGEIMVKYYRGPARKDMVTDATPEILARASEMPIIHRRPHSLYSDAGAYVGAVSQNLMRRYPRAWLANAVDSGRETLTFNSRIGIPSPGPGTDPQSPAGAGVVKNLPLYRLVTPLWNLQAPLLLLCYGLTALCILLLPVFLLAAPKSTPYDSAPQDATVLALAVATFATLAGYCLLSAYMPHYGVCYWAIFVLCATYFAQRAITFLPQNRRPN